MQKEMVGMEDFVGEEVFVAPSDPVVIELNRLQNQLKGICFIWCDCSFLCLSWVEFCVCGLCGNWFLFTCLLDHLCYDLWEVLMDFQWLCFGFIADLMFGQSRLFSAQKAEILHFWVCCSLSLFWMDSNSLSPFGFCVSVYLVILLGRCVLYIETTDG